jgi:ubiquinone biosynthesis protein
LFCILRYGARLLWAAAPQHGTLEWVVHLASRLHGSPGARQSLLRALPQLGPLIDAFVTQSPAQREALGRSLHDALNLLVSLERSLTAPLPPAETIPAIANAMGRPPQSAFASIEPIALESGIAEQVHGAKLSAAQSTARPNGGYVDTVIKLLRVKQVEQIDDDIVVLGWVARLLERFSRTARQLHVREAAQWLGAEVQQRFDLRGEAANLSQTSRHFSGDERVVVPEVVWELSTDHVLVMERIASLPVTDLETLRMRGIDLEALAERVVEVVVEQAFSHGFFHAALDAEHLRISTEPATLGRLVFGDGKIMATLTEPEREFFIHGAGALFEQDYGRLAAMHREAGHVGPDTRDEMLGAELRTRAEPHFAAPSSQRSPAALLAHLLTAVEPFDGGVSPALALAHQALERAESIALTLAPGFDTWQVVEGTLKGLAREDVGHRGWIKRLARELPHLAAMPRLPTLFVQRLQHAYDSARDRQESATWAAALHREQRLTRRLLWACALGGALLGAGAVWLVR